MLQQHYIITMITYKKGGYGVNIHDTKTDFYLKGRK